MASVSPSILSADFADLGKDVREATSLGADYLHIDVMDGAFVPNITIGPGVVKAIRGCTEIPFIAHLMIDHPEGMVEEFSKAGSDFITVHVEAKGDIELAMKKIRQSGKKVGMAINPPTPFSKLEPYMSELDIVLIMTVNPGWSGQKFIPEAAEKISLARKIIDAEGRNTLIEVDGGINAETGRICVDKGVDILAAGSYIFGAKDRKAAMESLKVLRRPR